MNLCTQTQPIMVCSTLNMDLKMGCALTSWGKRVTRFCLGSWPLAYKLQMWNTTFLKCFSTNTFLMEIRLWRMHLNLEKDILKVIVKNNTFFFLPNDFTCCMLHNLITWQQNMSYTPLKSWLQWLFCKVCLSKMAKGVFFLGPICSLQLGMSNMTWCGFPF